MSDTLDAQPRAPLTPMDCSVSGFDYMPLDVDRLLGSRAWLVCKRRPDLAFYMINLWVAAWKEVPAASLESDDDWLADKARCEFERWTQIKDDVLRGFVLCSDGRLYHEVIAIKALEAWLEKLGSRISSGNGNAAKYHTKFDDTHLRAQVQIAVAMLFALDPNSRYFTKRSGVVARLGAKPAGKPRAPKGSKTPKSPPDNGNSGSPGGSESGGPDGEDQDPRGIAPDSTPLDSTELSYVGGKPPTTPGADAPVDEGSHVGSEEQAARAALTTPVRTRGTPANAIPMADRNLVLPEWLAPHAQAWAAFEQIRWKKNAKAPYTLAAQTGILRELKKLLDVGQDLTAVLNASVNAGWTSVFAQRLPMRPQAGGATSSRYAGAAAGVFPSRQSRQEVIDVEAR